MKTEQRRWNSGEWETISDNGLSDSANLVLVFGGRNALSDAARFDEIKSFYPNANILSGTTAGEIIDVQVDDETIAVTAIEFEKTKLETTQIDIGSMEDSFKAGEKLANDLMNDELVHVFVVSDGLQVNGSELVKGFSNILPEKISVTGGLAGDAANFEKTLVGLNEAPGEGNIVAIGLYGDNIKIGHGSKGGWDPFGPNRIVTKSAANVLHELDGQSALELYKTYLGDKASGLPGTGLFFPLSIREKEGALPVVRTLLAVDEEAGTMTFAGDIPEGSIVQLMKANFDRLIDGAYDAAEYTTESIDSGNAELAILVSCVGRKLVLDQRIEEEVEGVRDVLGDNATITGFYSYGEISPHTALPDAPATELSNCELHNQTMTITTFSES